MSKAEQGLMTFFVFAAVIGMIGLCVNGLLLHDLKQQAIKIHYAQYNPVSGSWEWITNRGNISIEK